MRCIYNNDGYLVAFVDGNKVFLIDGTPLGLVRGSRVYDLNGRYIGTYDSDLEMVLIRESEIASIPRTQLVNLVKRLHSTSFTRRTPRMIPIGYKSVF